MNEFAGDVSMDPEPEPFEIRRREGTSVWWSRGSVITVRLRSEETGWPITLAEQLCPPGYSTPLHVHHEHDEALLARDGDVDIYYGTDQADLTLARTAPGDAVFLPKGAPHGFHNTASEPRALYILFESPLEKGFLEAGIPVETPWTSFLTPRRRSSTPSGSGRSMRSTPLTRSVRSRSTTECSEDSHLPWFLEIQTLTTPTPFDDEPHSRGRIG